MSTRSKPEREPHETNNPPAWDRLQPIAELRPYFLALAAQIRKWGGNFSSPLIVGVTSLADRAGKSTVAFNLAAALARSQGDKTLLIDANFDRTSNSLGADDRIGFTDFLVGDVKLRQCSVRLEHLNFDLMPSGTLGADRQANLPLELLGTIVEDQMDSYEFIIFDLPTVGSNVSFLSMSSQMNGVILVVQGARREHTAIAEFQKHLARTGAQLIGLVVNNGA